MYTQHGTRKDYTQHGTREDYTQHRLPERYTQHRLPERYTQHGTHLGREATYPPWKEGGYIPTMGREAYTPLLVP